MSNNITDVFKFNKNPTGLTSTYSYEVLSKIFDNDWLTYLFTGKKQRVRYYIRERETYGYNRWSNNPFSTLRALHYFPSLFNYSFYSLSDWTFVLFWDDPSEPQRIITEAKLRYFDNTNIDDVIFSSDDIPI